MASSIARLVAATHRALLASSPRFSEPVLTAAGPLAKELLHLLQASNGFYAFGAALHVFPSESNDLSLGVADWNLPSLWKHEYLSFVDPGLCFAEDVFGNQFSIRDGSIWHFQVETGELNRMARSVEKWAEIILADDRYWTGWPIAQRWAEHNAPIPLGKRLHPATPFACGGRYEVENLRPVDRVELMAYWGNFARQIHGLPDGARIKIVVSEDPSR